MKEATLHVVTFEVECPHCTEMVEYPATGSLMWPVFDGVEVMAGKVVKCSTCGEEFKLPATITNNLLLKEEK